MPKRKTPGSRADEAAIDALRTENDELRGLIVDLKGDLENERGNLRQMRREKATEVKSAVEHEQHKYNILLGDLRTKLRQEKINELDVQKESLVKKYENDINVLMKQREAEINRLRADLKKVQNDYEMANRRLEWSPTKKRRHDNASGNGTAEKRSPSPDVDELRKAKKQLEDAYGILMESDRQKSKTLKKMREYHKLEMSKMKKEVNQDVRKLVDEIGSKDRIIKQLEKELGYKSANRSKAQLKDAQELTNQKARSDETNIEGNSSKEEGTMSTKEETERRYMNRISDLSCKVCKLEDKCTELTVDKEECLRRNKELEKRLRPMQEKNRKFLQRNMELTTVNRCLEDKVKRLHDDNHKMKSQVEDIKKRSERLLHELNQEKMERVTIAELSEKLEDAENDTKELQKTIDTLRHSCSEKDRRIDLLKHRQKRARENRSKPLSGLRETLFGYEEIEGCKSLDSSWSSSVSNNTSIAEDSWDEFAREEFEKNYRRLIREHLELEKSYSLLQSQTDSYLDPERGGKHQGQLLADLLEAHSKIEDLERTLYEQGQSSKSEKRRQLPDISWIEEKQRLSIEKNDLLDKVQLLEAQEAKAHRELREVQEQHEIMEFRVLELEEIVEKLQRESRDVTSHHGVPTQDEDDLEITVLDLLDIDMVQLQHELLTVKYKHDGSLSKPEKTVLLQAKAMLDIADKRLKSSQSTETALKDRIRDLEDEKAKLLTDAGANPDLVIEYEDTRNKLLKADVQIEQLENEVKDLREQDAVHAYTEDAYAKREDRFKKEIDDLRRQLRSALEGRSAETELVDERAGKFSDYQKKAEQWEGMIKEMGEKIKELEKEKDEIRLQTLAASDPEVASILEQLRDQLIEKDKHETELMEKTDQLELDLEVHKEQNEELEKINGEVTKNYYDIKEALEGAKTDVEKMMKRIQGEKLGEDLDKIAELEAQVKKLESGRPSNDLDLDNQRLRVENIQLDEELKSKEKELKVKSEELQKLEKEFKAVDDENTVLRKKFFERSQSDKTDVPRLKVQIKAKEYEVSQLKEGQKELEKRIEELEQIKEEPIVKMETESQLQSAPGMTPDQLSDPEKTGLEKKIADLGESETTLKGRVDDLETSEKALKDNVQDLLKQLNDREEEYKHVKEKVDQEKTDLEAEIEDLQDMTNQLKENEKALKNRLNELEQESDENESKLKEENRGLDDKCQSLEMKNIDLTELVTQSEVEKDKLKNQLRDLENQNKDLLDERENLREQVEDTKEQGYERSGKLQEELDNYHANEQKLSESLVEAEQTEHLLREKLKHYEGPTSELQKLDALKKQLSELEAENSQLHEKVDDLQAQLRAAAEFLDETEAKYQEEIKDLEEEISDHQKHKEAQDEKLDQLEQNESDLHDQLMAEQGKNKELASELSKIKQEHDDLGKTIEVKQAEVDKLLDKEAELAKVVEEKQELSAMVNDKDEELAKVKKEKDDLNVALKEKYAEVIKAEDEHEQKIKDTEDEYEDAIADLEAKLKKNETELEKLHESVEGYEETVAGLQTKLGKMEAELEKLHESVEGYEETVAGLQTKLGKKESELEKLHEAVEGYEETVADLQTKLGKREAELDRSQESIKELEELLEKQGAEGNDNLTMVMELREDCENKQNIVLELDDKLREVENDFDKARAETQEKEHDIMDLKDQLQHMQQQLESEQEGIVEKDKALEGLNQDLLNEKKDKAEKAKGVEELESQLAQAQEEREKNHERITELEESLDQEVKEGAKYLEKLNVQELNHIAKEKELLEKLKSLEDNLADATNDCAKNEETITVLEPKLTDLKNQLLDAERFNEELKDESESLKKHVNELKEQLDEKSEEIMHLEEEFDAEKEEDKASSKDLQDRINVLRNSEEKLLERIIQLERNEKELRDELDSDESQAEETKTKVEGLESDIANLKLELKEKDQLVKDSEKENSKLAIDIESLNKRVKILDESEAKLMEMLQESEDRETDARHALGESEEKIHDLEEKVESMESNDKDLKDGIDDLEQMVSDLEMSEKELKDKLNIMKQNNDLLEAKCDDLEKTEQDLLQQLALAQLDNVTREESLQAEAAPVFEEAVTADFVDGVHSAPKSLPKGRLSRTEKDNLRRSLGRKSADELVNCCVELTDMQQELQSRLHDLEDSSMDRSRTESVERELDDFSHREQRYKDTIARLQEEIGHLATGAKSDSSAKSGVDKKPEDYKDRLDSLHTRLDSFITKSEQAHHHPPSYMPKTTDISDLPEDELISKIQQLEIGEISNKRKICELEDCIKIYRQVVETVAYAMATDLEGLNLDLEKKELMQILGRKDTGYEGKLQELINSESGYKKQLVDMERREALYKADLLAAQTELRDSRKEYNHHIEDLQNTITELEKHEAKLKSKLNLGSKDRTTETVSKIHDLKDHIIDLEASEKHLRRTVQDLQTEREDLRQKVSETHSHPPSTHGPVDRLRDLEHQQEVDELQAKIRQLDNAETVLQDQVLKLRSQDNTGHAERIEHLERSERALQRKIEMYESHDFDDEPESLMDKPEDLLRQRIHELEKMEKHLRSQITDLENDREELHEIARKDKNTIHELNVKRRELQLAEKNLKEQVNMFEVTENNLLAKIDAMQDELDDQEDQLSRVKRAEKNWKGQAKELKFTEESAAKKVINLEVLVEELQSSETKLKKTLYTAEQENLALKDKIETLQEQLYDLQSNEIAIKQRIRDLENRERTLQCDLAKFECSENVAARRSGDLESLTDSLSERIYALEEERANLQYQVSDLAVVYEDTKKQAALLENNEIALKQQIDYLETNEKRLQKRNQELEIQRIELLRKADDAGHSELKQKDLVQALERSEKKLKFKLQELDNNAASLERGHSKIKELEKENTSLQDELYECNRKIQRMEKVIKTLEDKQRQADLTRSRGGTAVITRQELAEMRAQVGLLEKTEESLLKAEKNEVNLKETIAQLRRGKNVCGHEQELGELQKQLAHYQNLLREKAAIEEKYNHVRSELRILQDSIKDGDVIVAVRKRGADDRPAQFPRDQFVQDFFNEQQQQLQEPDQQEPMLAENSRMSKSGTKRSEKRRPRSQDDGDESDSSSLDEHPVAGMNMRRTSNMFEFKDNGPHHESDQWQKVEQAAQPVPVPEHEEPYWKQVEQPKEEVAVSLNISDNGSDEEKPRRRAPLPPPERFGDQSDFMDASPERRLPRLHRKGSYDTDSGISTMPDSHHPHRLRSSPTTIQSERLSPVHAAPTQQLYHAHSPTPSDSHLSPWLTQQLVDQKSISTSTVPLMHSSLPLAWPEGPQRSIATDTTDITRRQNDEIGELKNRIEDLETELRVKTRELETSQFVTRDLEEKDAADNSETVQKLKSEIDRIQDALQNRQHECTDLEVKLRTLNNQNERKEKDIELKAAKIDEINREMRRCQTALKEAEAVKLKSVGDLRNAEIDLTRLKDADKKLQKLKEEHHELQVNHADLQNELRKLDRAKKERDELEFVVDDLKKRIQDYDQIKGERADLEMKVKLLEEQLEHKYDEMEKIKDRAERAVAPLRAKVMRLAQKCKEKDELIRRLAEDLKHSGHGNPDLLHQVDHMRADMAHEEYNRPESPIGGMTAFDDDAFSPPSSKKSPYSPRSSENQNVDQVLHNDLFSTDHQSDIIPTRLEKVEHAPPSLFTDSLYDQPSRIPRLMESPTSPLNNQRGPVPRGPSRHSPKSDLPETNCFVAIADYDPTNFSRSGHPRLELPLKEGDVVQVFGPPDDKGYYEAEVNGRTGLVPNNYLQPMSSPESQGPKKRKSKKMPPSHIDASPEHILDMHDQLEHAHIPTHDASANRPHHGHLDRPSNGLSQPGSAVTPMYIPIPSHGCTEILPTTIIRDVSQPNTLERLQPQQRDVFDGRGSPALPRQLGPPEPPSDFHIERILSDHNVMMEWSPPPMDEFDRSNGVQISGYKIYVDGVECHHLSSPHLSKALIGRLNLHVPHKITIRSYTSLGQTSRTVDTYFQDVLPDLRDGMSDLGSALGDNFDGGSITSSNFYESGERRKCMAVYDFNPAEQSPNSDPINELSFKTGDVVFTYGPVREDGFFHAKIRGRRGLVPESFIEEMPQSRRKNKHGKKVASTSSKGSRDYSPREHKPSKHHDAEPARLY